MLQTGQRIKLRGGALKSSFHLKNLFSTHERQNNFFLLFFCGPEDEEENSLLNYHHHFGTLFARRIEVLSCASNIIAIMCSFVFCFKIAASQESARLLIYFLLPPPPLPLNIIIVCSHDQLQLCTNTTRRKMTNFSQSTFVCKGLRNIKV